MTQDVLDNLLSKTSPDLLIAQAGTVDLQSTLSSSPSLKQVIWVTQPGSQHMDWNEVPEGSGSEIGVSVWQDLIDKTATSTSSEVLPVDNDTRVSPVSTFWPSDDGSYELVEFTSEASIPYLVSLA